MPESVLIDSDRAATDVAAMGRWEDEVSPQSWAGEEMRLGRRGAAQERGREGSDQRRREN